jgi:hypothetical protein
MSKVPDAHYDVTGVDAIDFIERGAEKPDFSLCQVLQAKPKVIVKRR